MTIRIEKDVPIPPRRNRSKYPLAEMEVGDSFIGDFSARAAAYAYGYRTSKVFTARVIAPGRMRVWRMA